MASDQWARVRIGVDCGLRHGAWYRVKRLTPLGRPAASMRCQRCNGVFEIGWGDELY